MWGGGGTLAQEGPPSVQPGTAAENCQRIVDEGYSPHDYIYSVLFYGQRFTHHDNTGIDYFHFLRYYSGVAEPVSVLAFTVDGLKAEREGVFSGYQILLQEFLVTEQSDGTYVAGPRLGNLLDSRQGHVRYRDRGLRAGLNQELSEYRWRPTGAPDDGSGDIIYRDRPSTAPFTTSASFTETEWIHDPDWDGAEGARMSSIWGDVAECSG